MAAHLSPRGQQQAEHGSRLKNQIDQEAPIYGFAAHKLARAPITVDFPSFFFSLHQPRKRGGVAVEEKLGIEGTMSMLRLWGAMATETSKSMEASAEVPLVPDCRAQACRGWQIQ